MAKQFKHLSIDEKIEITKTKITETDSTLKALRQQLVELKQERETLHLKEISDLINQSELTFDDVKSLIANHISQSA